MKVEEIFPMRNWIVAAVVGTVCSSLCGSPGTVEQIKLSDGVKGACDRLHGLSESGPAVLVIDVARLDDSETSYLMDTLSDLRASQRAVFAVCKGVDSTVEAGASIVALTSDATVVVGDVTFIGAESDWCASASRRQRLEKTLTTLGGLESKLAARLLSSENPLCWSTSMGYLAPLDGPGSIRLAERSQPLSCTASTLREINVDVPQYDSLAAAVQAIEDGSVQPRAKGKKVIASGKSGQPASGKDPGSGRPGGSLGGSGKSGGGASPSTPPATPPSTPAPSVPKSAPAPAAPAPINEAKLAEEVAEYGKALGELKGLLREFNDYYKGVKGIWTSPNKGLKWVWDDRSDHTEHKDTKMTCQRLQRDIKTKMSTLESCLKTVERIVKDKEHPDLVRMKANVPTIDGLRAAFERNKVSNYETYYGQVMSLK